MSNCKLARTRSLRFALGALAATLALVPAALGSGAASAANNKHTPHRDYLKAHTTSVGADQCSKPVSERKGAWFCPRRSATKLVPRAGWCSAGDDACWNVNDDKISGEASTAGAFGYGGRDLGAAGVWFDFRLNGGQSVSKPVDFNCSCATSSVVFEGERLYMSAAHPEGNGVNGGASYAFYEAGPKPFGEDAYWLPNGYKYYENTVSHGAIVHEATWKLADYPGSWYTFVKSPIFDMTRSGYRLTTPQNVPSDAYGGGYHPAS